MRPWAARLEVRYEASSSVCPVEVWWMPRGNDCEPASPVSPLCAVASKARVPPAKSPTGRTTDYMCESKTWTLPPHSMVRISPLSSKSRAMPS